MRRALAVAAAVIAAWLVAAAGLFVWPHDDEPIAGRADAVVSLAGSRARLPLAERLVREGVAPTLVVSYSPVLNDRRAHELCGDGPRDGVVCFRADPFSTDGEAQAIGRLARERGWNDLVVVTSDFHVYRSRLLVERCFAGRLRMAGAPSSLPYRPWALVTETAKLVYALTVDRDCDPD